ncbi:protein MEI2-like 4 isoform X2 [Brassica rapa]|uniref:protein MEI2-like 4 isoform X2 n=1 Tax=Brassica napus TaxID=3708 RepID=UPI000872D3CF|nr:protein MEI2-like 4 isoform X2 [Brassica napus]XP_018511202.1 protein MEI2-like 4 isoform X2 [Brassica rapa]
MPSDISEPRAGGTDLRTTPPQKLYGFMKTNPVPEGGGDRSSNRPQQSSFSAALPSAIPNGRTSAASDSHWESSLFSSSFSEIFSRKLRLPRSDNLSFMPAYPEEEPSQSLQEMEAQTIGNLLPDEDDFFAGVVGHKSRANGGDDLDDCDLFSSVGGMELEGDVFSSVSQRAGKRGGSNVFGVGEPPRGEVSSRVLFVTNMDSIIEDYELRALFEQYGDVRALHTAGKNRGFILVSYYDIRAAQNAMRALHGRLLRGRKLDVHYHIPKENSGKENASEGALLVNNLDSSVSSEEFYRIVSSYGEIREVRRMMPENSQIYIEFFDVRTAEAALRGLNGLEIAGRQLKLAPYFPEGTSFTSQFAADDVEGGLPKMAFNNLSSAQIGRHYPGILASTSTNGGSMRMMHHSVGSPVNSFSERHQSRDIPIGMPTSTRIISASKPVGLQESGNPFDSSNTGIQSMPNLHPHSLHEYLDNFASGSPYKSSTAFSEMVSDGQKANEGFMMSNVRGVGVDGFNGGVIGSPANGGSHRANPNLWSSSNPSNGMMWPNSPSRVNGITSQRIPPVTGFSRASPLMVNMASSPVHHHIGSAPVFNSPFWDRRQTYVAEPPESSGFHFGSHGSMGYPGSSSSHAMEMASHKVFSHAGGNRMDANSSNAVSRSSRQMPHFLSGRNPMLSVPGSFDLPNERYRNLSQRRSEFSSSNAEKKLFELDVDRILRGEDSRTTLMIKNIPNKYTSKMLLAAIDEYCKGTYDFLYLPIDFKNKCNVGYAFINLTEPENIVPFYKAFNGKKWEKFNSEKVAYLAYGRIQGKSALIAHFQNSSLMNEDKRCRPILFHTDGPNAGDQEPFPMGTNIRSRPGKHRTSSIENYNNNFSSSSENREEPPNGTDSF